MSDGGEHWLDLLGTERRSLTALQLLEAHRAADSFTLAAEARSVPGVESQIPAAAVFRATQGRLAIAVPRAGPFDALTVSVRVGAPVAQLAQAPLLHVAASLDLGAQLPGQQPADESSISARGMRWRPLDWIVTARSSCPPTSSRTVASPHPQKLGRLLQRQQQRRRGAAVVLGLHIGSKEVPKPVADVAVAARVGLLLGTRIGSKERGPRASDSRRWRGHLTLVAAGVGIRLIRNASSILSWISPQSGPFGQLG